MKAEGSKRSRDNALRLSPVSTRTSPQPRQDYRSRPSVSEVKHDNLASRISVFFHSFSNVLIPFACTPCPGDLNLINLIASRILLLF